MFDRTIALCKVIASSVSAKTKAVMLDLVGPGGSTDLQHPEAEESGETASAQPSFGALGMIARPAPPSKVDGRSSYTETFAVRTGDGLVPVAYRDLRLNAAYPAPKPASMAWVGWGGAFDANEAKLSSDGKPVSTVRTIYVPYAFGGGTAPSKAHAIAIDGTAGNESITIVHGDGMSVTMAHGGVVVANAAGDAYVEVKASGITLNGNTVVNGGATLGSPAGAKALAMGPAVTAYLEDLEKAIGAALTAVGVGVAASGANGKTAFEASVSSTLTALRAVIPTTKVMGL